MRVKGLIGIIANPASGKDIRRLVSAASVFDNQEKRNIVRRVVLGALAAGADQFCYLPDTHRIAESAFEGLDGRARFEPVDSPETGSALDTTRAATRMRERGCGAVITLGGDGTNRAAALGWRDLPLVAVSTGTNNVFPRMIEGTLAGAAGGLVATGRLSLAQVARQAKTLRVSIDGEPDDLALIDVALLDEVFTGAKAMWDPARLRTIVLARAEPDSVGLSALGGLLHPVSDAMDGGLVVSIGADGGTVTAPIAPGLYADVPVSSHRPLPEGEAVVLEGPGMLALDGERERRLKSGQTASVRVVRDGPWVIDVHKTLAAAACAGLYRRGFPGSSHGD
jgi:predicted polyphosphate/ATP-dependent NAD kinase